MSSVIVSHDFAISEKIALWKSSFGLGDPITKLAEHMCIACCPACLTATATTCSNTWRRMHSCWLYTFLFWGRWRNCRFSAFIRRYTLWMLSPASWNSLVMLTPVRLVFEFVQKRFQFAFFMHVLFTWQVYKTVAVVATASVAPSEVMYFM